VSAARAAYSAAIRGQSVSPGVTARAWQAAIAACRAYCPRAPPSATARFERGEPAPDQHVVPARAVLVEQQHGLAPGAGPGAQPRRLDLHQRDQAVDLGLVRHELGEDPAEPERVLAQRRPHPVIARARGVALVEHEVEHLEHRGQPLGEIGAARDLVRDAGLGERPLGPDDPLRHGRLGDQERPGDLRGGQPAEQPEGERDPAVRR